MKYIISKIYKYWQSFVFFVRCHLFNKALRNKECLKIARKSDVKGNYDIDGVSFDGDHIYVGGKTT